MLYTFGGFFHEHDLRGHHDEPEIQKYRVVTDIGQIQLQLIVKGGVVLTVHLGKTREACLDLQAVSKFRNLLFDVCRNLRPFRTGADQGHLSF